MRYQTEWFGRRIDIDAPEGLFSPKGLDAGTRAMLAEAKPVLGDKALDLGCGTGVVGVALALLLGEDRVILCDSDPLAVETARRNAQSNGVAGVDARQSDAFAEIPERDFTLILSNPPYHADFSVAKRFIEQGFTHLTAGGRMVMVTRRRTWYENKLKAVFGGVKVRERDGYFVFIAEKRTEKPAPKPRKAALPSKKLRRKAERERR